MWALLGPFVRVLSDHTTGLVTVMPPLGYFLPPQTHPVLRGMPGETSTGAALLMPLRVLFRRAADSDLERRQARFPPRSPGPVPVLSELSRPHTPPVTRLLLLRREAEEKVIAGHSETPSGSEGRGIKPSLPLLLFFQGLGEGKSLLALEQFWYQPASVVRSRRREGRAPAGEAGPFWGWLRGSLLAPLCWPHGLFDGVPPVASPLSSCPATARLSSCRLRVPGCSLLCPPPASL